MNRKALLVIGPEPPPATGMEVATQALVAELDRASIQYIRVNTADPLDELGNRGSWTAHNIGLAVRHIFTVIRKTFGAQIGAVYLPIAQEFPGLLRDICFLLIARAARRPVIVHLHGGSFGTFYATRNAVMRGFLRWTVGNASLGIVLTESLRPALECLLPPERVAVVPNGIDRPTSSGRCRRSDETISVLFLSSLTPQKGPRVFIEAFARAHERCPSLRGTVAGPWASDAIRNEVLAIVRALQVEEVLTFPGLIEGDAKAALFESADIFCFASPMPEGQPFVILEAMAVGLPVVAPAWPGIADTVVDGKTGILVPAGSSEALANALVELARDRDLCRLLGTAGRERYERTFTRDAFGERMIQVIRPFIAREPRPAKATGSEESVR
jgi:glycosyltransferase involved in cell wall biosynthesis